MYNDQDRPPWLRNLRPARPEPDLEPSPPAPTVAEPPTEVRRTEVTESPEEVSRSVISRRQLLLLAVLLWANVSILGCLCLLATQVVIP